MALSFQAPREPGVFLNPYAVLHASASVEPSGDAWDLLDRLAKVYVGPGAPFPGAKAPGFVIRYEVERIGGHGPWAPKSS